MCMAMPYASQAVTDITFFAVSDTHYGQSSATSDANRLAMVGNLNALPGVNYPASVGGAPVAQPRAVLMPGDLIDRPDAGLWANYVADYGVNGEGRLKFPVYDGLGNHDVWNYGTSQSSTLIKQAIIARNAKRAGIVNYDSEHLHYSWDWDQVHFVHLNLFAGAQIGTSPQWDPFQSLQFLKADLEKNVGTSGRPVLILQHFNVDTAQDYYQNSQKAAMIALLKNYNCIGLLHGHSHSKKVYAYQGIDIYDDGTAMNGDIMVFRITDGKMFVVNRIGTSWGTLKLEKNITMGSPVALQRGSQGRSAGRGGSFIFNVAGVGRIYAANRKALSVDITRLDGTRVRRYAATEGEMSWNRLDERGGTCPAGMYLVRIATQDGPFTEKVLLR